MGCSNVMETDEAPKVKIIDDIKEVSFQILKTQNNQNNIGLIKIIFSFENGDNQEIVGLEDEFCSSLLNRYCTNKRININKYIFYYDDNDISDNNQPLLELGIVNNSTIIVKEKHLQYYARKPTRKINLVFKDDYGRSKPIICDCNDYVNFALKQYLKYLGI